MSQLPSMPMWWADFFSKTDHLSNDEQWAYAKLLAKTWLRNCQPFPDNARNLARLLDLTTEKWIKIRSRILPFFDLSGGTWRQLRLEKEWEFVQCRSAISQRNGRLGGRPKKSVSNGIENPAGSVQGTQNETTHTHTKKEVEKDTLTGVQKERGERGSRLPTDFEVPFDWIEAGRQAREKAILPPVDLATEAQKFCNHFVGSSTPSAVKRDWRRTWLNWCLNARGSANGRLQRSSPHDDETAAFEYASRH
jgi:uncharacterized protein YdaU (DUF1376 family)